MIKTKYILPPDKEGWVARIEFSAGKVVQFYDLGSCIFTLELRFDDAIKRCNISDDDAVILRLTTAA